MSPTEMDAMPVGMVDIFVQVANDDIKERNRASRKGN